MANNFVNGISKQEYLFKLIPDLSVFDVVERYFIDNNYQNINDDLFFYICCNHSNQLISPEPIKFRRFVIKTCINSETTKINEEKAFIQILPVNENANFLRYELVIDNELYIVIIDEQFLSEGFLIRYKDGINSGYGDFGNVIKKYIIGVCF